MTKPNSILSLTLPLMAAFLAQKGMQLIDTIMMGWLGAYALAAGALGTSIFFTSLTFCMGTLSAVGVFVARARGANNSDDIRSSMHHGLLLTILLSIPCFILIWFAPYFLSWLGEDPHVVANVILLVHGLAWGIPGFLLFFTMREFISAFSLTRIVMMVTIISIPLTGFVNYALIYGKYGLPKLDIAGIGYASASIMWFMFLCLWFYAKNQKSLKNYLTFSDFKFQFAKITDMLYIGAPSGILLILESGMFAAAVILMGKFGVDNLAAYQITMQCASLAYAIPFSLSMSSAILVGHAIGAKNLAEAKRSAFVCLSLALLFSIMVAGIFILMPTTLARLFFFTTEPNAAVIKAATAFLTIAAFFQCVDAMQAIANGALRGMRDTFVPMLISIGCYWILGILSAYYLSRYTSLAANGIWYGLTLGIFASGIILMARLLIKIRDSSYNS